MKYSLEPWLNMYYLFNYFLEINVFSLPTKLDGLCLHLIHRPHSKSPVLALSFLQRPHRFILLRQLLASFAAVILYWSPCIKFWTKFETISGFPPCLVKLNLFRKVRQGAWCRVYRFKISGFASIHPRLPLVPLSLS